MRSPRTNDLSFQAAPRHDGWSESGIAQAGGAASVKLLAVTAITSCLFLVQHQTHGSRQSKPARCQGVAIHATQNDVQNPCQGHSSRRLQVAVIGGGLGGLAVAIGLLGAGVDVLIYEKSDRLRDTSQGVIAIWPNGMKALRDLHPDLPDELGKAGGVAVTSSTIMGRTADAPAGPNSSQVEATPMFLSLSQRFGMGAMFVAWSDVQRVLAARVPEDRIKLGKKLEHIEECEDHVKLSFQDGSHATVAVAIAADGTFSTARQILQDAGHLPQSSQVRFFGQSNWASIIKGYDDPFFGITKGSGRNVMLNLASHPPIGTYLISLGGGRMFWQVRTTDDKRMFRQTDEAGCLGAQGSKQQLLALIREIPEVRAAVEATPEGAIYERSIYDLHPSLTKFVAGRVVLMGDAAHAAHTLPGHGANFAFEDAAELAMNLGHLPHDGNGLAEALEAYEAARLKRCHDMQAWAAEAGASQKKGAQLSREESQRRSAELYGWCPPSSRHGKGS